jgi:hypothetical protein
MKRPLGETLKVFAQRLFIATGANTYLERFLYAFSCRGNPFANRSRLE